MQGIRRTTGAAPARKTPATAEKVVAMVTLTGIGTRDVRDRALLLLGFAGAFRRSELVGLDVSDIEFCDGGMRVHIRRSKTDQEGAGATIAIVGGSIACPVKAVRAWLEISGATTDPCFGSSAKARPAFRPRCCGGGEGGRASRGTKRSGFQRAFAPIRLPDIRCDARRLDLQNDGPEPP